MIKARIVLPIVFLLISSCTLNEVAQKQQKAVDYVDPFIGTGGHGHTYPGATSPFGRVQPSPDNGTAGWDWCSGYNISDSIISGFGQLHLSGTGIGDLADILLMPTKSKMDLSLFGKTRDSLPYTSKFSHVEEIASPGYYKVLLKEPNISVELTANDYVAYHKYTYNNEENPSFVIDLGYAVNWDKPLDCRLKLEDANHIVGHRYSTGWAKNQKVFFAIESSSPITQHQLIGDGLLLEDQIEVNGTHSGGQFFFKTETKTVEVKIAVSSVSVENAKENLRLQGSANFEETHKKTGESWNNVLSNISIETPIDSLKTIFYTALYHTQVAPTLFNDVNGEFRLQNDSITKTDFKVYSTLSLWDVFRTETPLLSIIDPTRIDDMVKSMLTYYDQSGVLPVWVLSGNETGTMPGYHSVSVVSEAIMKGHNGFDVEKAYNAMKTTMMGDERGLKPYKEFGYIPFETMDQSVSISLEYAYNDWCVAQVAKKLGKDKDYKYFSERSKAYQNFYDIKSGFLRGKSLERVFMNLLTQKPQTILKIQITLKVMRGNTVGMFCMMLKGLSSYMAERNPLLLW